MPNFITKLFSSGATKLVEGIGGVLDELITSKDEKLAAELKIKELIARHEVEMETEITSRWASDMNSDSWLSKNVRPMVLIFLVVSTVILVFIDAGVIDFIVEDKWVDLLQLVLITVIGAYFGGRSMEKVNNNKKNSKYYIRNVMGGTMGDGDAFVPTNRMKMDVYSNNGGLTGYMAGGDVTNVYDSLPNESDNQLVRELRQGGSSSKKYKKK